MRRAFTTFALLAVAFLTGPVLAFQPDVNDKMELDVQKAILAIKKADPGIQKFFDNSAGYAVFPGVGKGGLIVGGAFGRGLVIANAFRHSVPMPKSRRVQESTLTR